MGERQKAPGVGPAGSRSFFTICSDVYSISCSKMTCQSVCCCKLCVIKSQEDCTCLDRCQVVKHPISEHAPSWCSPTQGCLLTFVYLLQKSVYTVSSNSLLE